LYNLGYLDVATRFEDSEIFEEYAAWLYQLLCNLMKDISKDRLKDQMILHYEILSETLLETLSGDEAKKQKSISKKQSMLQFPKINILLNTAGSMKEKWGQLFQLHLTITI